MPRGPTGAGCGLDVVVHLYAPEGAPAAAAMVVSTPRPKLTPARAALVSIVDRYAVVATGVSLIEIQKLMYLLQAAGEDLRLHYQARFYGPYADNLRHVLKSLEGHHLQGFGDGSRKVRQAEMITVLPDAAEEAADALEGRHATIDRIERVLRLAEGFESAYGLELLASTHWVTVRDQSIGDLDGVVRRIQSWNRRKARMFTAAHIEAAWSRLRGQGWLTPLPAAV